ncbi:Y-family DNA polymerase [Roseovarius dicentrarchi]|uniref:Y-family DNA polymerase n=1 Tax=Roseovarius dicentrarchi TaxID=2250573 RepID=UPI000DE9E388|nr:DNA polymerase Y family protein [Roseovarius dicentrarchi]
MANRRILSVWFPRLGADRLLRRLGDLHGAPFAVLEETGQMQIISALCPLAEAAGLRVGQPARDAHAMCAGLITRTRNIHAEAAFLNVLTRWAGRYTPWVAAQPPDALMLDITGCAHLFGGEAAMMAGLAEEAGDMGVAAICGLADTPGAAWALARYAGRGAGHDRSGDAIDQEARATRSRAAKRRHWERGGTAPATAAQGSAPRIAAPGQTRQALANLPVAALRLDGDTTAALARLGLRRIGELTGQPRGPLARRFGRGLLMRMDQALGAAPEPVSPHAAPPRFATRISLPDPIGLRADVEAALGRLIPRLCEMLRIKGQGARALRLEAYRCDDTMVCVEIGLARPADLPERIAPLFALKLDDLDAGYGIDVLRLEATRTEPLHSARPAGHLDATNAARNRAARDTALEDLIGRIGARTGLDAITRRHPASSHIPEKCASVQPAAWSEAAPPGSWPSPPNARPLLLWRPELVTAHDAPRPPLQFRWRGALHDLSDARGPERIAPEWWLDEPEWRSGVRDYWDIVTQGGARLWLFYAHGAALSPGWFCQGQFA